MKAAPTLSFAALASWQSSWDASHFSWSGGCSACRRCQRNSAGRDFPCHLSRRPCHSPRASALERPTRGDRPPIGIRSRRIPSPKWTFTNACRRAAACNARDFLDKLVRRTPFLATVSTVSKSTADRSSPSSSKTNAGRSSAGWTGRTSSSTTSRPAEGRSEALSAKLGSYRFKRRSNKAQPTVGGDRPNSKTLFHPPPFCGRLRSKVSAQFWTALHLREGERLNR